MPYRPAWLPEAVKEAEPEVKSLAPNEAAPRPGVVVSVPGVGPLVLDRPIDSPVSSWVALPLESLIATVYFPLVTPTGADCRVGDTEMVAGAPAVLPEIVGRLRSDVGL